MSDKTLQTDWKYHLGDKLRDTISGFEGTCTSRHDYLNNCKRYGIAPKKLTADGKPVDAMCIDEDSLELVEAAEKPVDGNVRRAGGPTQEAKSPVR